MKEHLILIFFLQIVFSCTHRQDQTRPNSFAPTVVEAKGYIVPADSVSEPKVIPVDESKLKKVPVGKPTSVPTNTNIHPAGIPKIVLAGIPRVNTPGQDSFSLPKTVPAIDSPFMAAMPEIVIAKDPYIKDQNPQNFSSFSKMQGLIHDNITCLYEDKIGNLWIGTANGVSKYDGKYFTNYPLLANIPRIIQDNKDNIWFATRQKGVTKFDGKFFTHFGEKEGLSGNEVTSMLQDKSGTIWFGTDKGGVSKYDEKSFTHFTVKEGLADNNVNSILQDNKGNIWFGTNKGISKYDGRSFTNFTMNEGLINNNVYNMLQDKNGNLWFGTNKGVSKFDGRSFTNFTEKEGLSKDHVYSMLQDKNGNMWFGTYGGGASKYDGKYFTHYTETEGLPNNNVLSILQDKSGNLWFSTFAGLSKYDGTSFTHFTKKEGLYNFIASTYFFNTLLLQDKNGNLWFGTAGTGAIKYDGKSFTHFTKKEGLISNDVHSLLLDKGGNLWFGAVQGLSKYDGKFFTNFTEGFDDCVITFLLQDKSENLWIGTNDRGVFKFDGKSFTNFTVKEGLSSNCVSCILQDKNGNIWFGTYGGGVTKYDGKSFTHFTGKEGLGTDKVLCMLEDNNGNLWFGTHGGGVSIFDGKFFTHLTEKEGLINNTVSGMLQDKRGNLWFNTVVSPGRLSKENLAAITDAGSNRGKLNMISERNVLFKNVTYEDGFLGRGTIRNAIYEDNDGTIWIGTQDRLTAYHPEGETADTIPPNIQLTGLGLFSENIEWRNLENKKDSTLTLGNGVKVRHFKFDGLSKWYGLPENLSLAYDNNYLTFNFIGITLKSPKKVKYQYKLDGIDKNWSAITTANQAPYGNMPSGTFTFRVKAMNSEGYWSDEIKYSFTIRPPWWKTWWAYILYFLIITGSIWYYIKWRERALKERQKVLEKTVTERTAEVVAEKKEVERQKERSEELLLNILPLEVAEELKQKGNAEAKQFDEVTVMFTDFKGFTQISEKLSPAELVAEIHTCFMAFDNIVTRYNIEKIKTLGDGYMCAGGLPVINKTNAADVVSAALEIQQFIHQHREQKIKNGKEPFEIRIGINTGPVVAGIVGIKKFAYDIWGDTVNIASRMESSGEPGKVNISGSTYELVKDKFNCIYRGKIEAKNKGTIDMYFVESIS